MPVLSPESPLNVSGYLKQTATISAESVTAPPASANHQVEGDMELHEININTRTKSLSGRPLGQIRTVAASLDAHTAI
jgi:hypothetical protein